MAIAYTSIINCVVSSEGYGGNLTNYFYYTILVVDTNGNRDIVTGKYENISHLLRYIRTPMDELAQLHAAVKDLRNDMNSLIDQKINYFIESLFPIPDILNQNEVTALRRLEDAGLIPVLVNSYPASTPRNGIVRAFERDSANFKKVNVRIIHPMPAVNGLKADEALRRLQEAGFTVSVEHVVVSEKENDIVLSCGRKNEDSLHAYLTVSTSIPETIGMPVEDAVKLLNELGYRAEIVKTPTSTPPGFVLNWVSKTENEVTLHVSIPEKYLSKSIEVKWKDMQDSVGDVYGAVAEYDNKRGELRLIVTYASGAKSKHQITSISCKEFFGSQQPRLLAADTMEPGEKGSFDIILPIKKSYEMLPQNLVFQLETQFGLLKKKDCITLQFSIAW